MIGWDEKFPSRDMGNGKVRGVGVAMSMQGSAISGVDVGSVTIKVNDDGFYSLMIGAADMGTGCDTTLSQVAADCLGCSVDDIIVHGVDTDVSPYYSGSYASSTMYLTGGAVVKTCESLVTQIFNADFSLSIQTVYPPSIKFRFFRAASKCFRTPCNNLSVKSLLILRHLLLPVQ